MSVEEKRRRIAQIHAKARGEVDKLMDVFYEQRNLILERNYRAERHDEHATKAAIARLREERDILIGVVREQEAEAIMKVQGM